MAHKNELHYINAVIRSFPVECLQINLPNDIYFDVILQILKNGAAMNSFFMLLFFLFENGIIYQIYKIIQVFIPKNKLWLKILHF